MYDKLSIIGRQNKWPDIQHSLLCFHHLRHFDNTSTINVQIHGLLPAQNLFFVLVTNLKIMEEKKLHYIILKTLKFATFIWLQLVKMIHYWRVNRRDNIVSNRTVFKYLLFNAYPH
jgi:hypothetical protein